MKLLKLLAKYKNRYKIQIFEFVIMDNHAHLILRAGSAECLGNFMRTVNSQLARFINCYFDRDSQALRERYKSPMITTSKYLLDAIKYVWTNRFKVDQRLRPDRDFFCSAFWRLYKPYKKIEMPIGKSDTENNLLAGLLDSYKKLGISHCSSEEEFIKKLLSEALKTLSNLIKAKFENSHTIGDECVVKFRGELLSAFRRCHDPPLHGS